MSKPTSRLPARPSLEQLRKQAKDLLRELHAGVDDALFRLRAVFGDRTESPSAPEIPLADAQHVIAREHGFDSWPKLVRHVQALTSPALREYTVIAEELAKAYRSADASGVRAINAKYALSFPWDRDPQRMQERLTTWFASSDRTAEQAIVDARALVASQAGFDSWGDLAARVSEDIGVVGSNRNSQPPAFYRIDETTRCLDIHGPVPSNGWAQVLALMAERRLTGLRAGRQMTDDALALLSRLGDSLRLLDIGGSNAVSDDGLRQLSTFTALEALYLGGWDSPLTDHGLSILRSCTQLQTFHMGWHRRATDAGLSHLAACDKLVDVNLMGSSTGDGALSALAGKPALTRLRAGNRVTSGGLAALYEIPHFRTWHGGEGTIALMGAEIGPTFLMLPQRPFAAGDVSELARLDGLFGLSFFTMGEAGGQPIDGRGLAPLTRLGHLGFLACDPTDDGMASIAAIPALRMLSCQHTRAGDDGFIALSKSPSLELVWGRAAQNLGRRGFVALSTIDTLRGLAVNLRHVDTDALSSLAEFPSLRELSPMGLRDEGFRHVGTCRELQALWLMDCEETGDEATTHISRLPTLEKYFASSTKITDRSLALLATMHSLTEVQLSDCFRVTDAGIAELAALPRLRRLDLEAMPGVSNASLRVFRPNVRTTCRW
jgi:hypothetical protein